MLQVGRQDVRRQGGAPVVGAAAQLGERPGRLGLSAQRKFDTIRYKLNKRAYTWDIWAAAYVIEDDWTALAIAVGVLVPSPALHGTVRRRHRPAMRWRRVETGGPRSIVKWWHTPTREPQVQRSA